MSEKGNIVGSVLILFYCLVTLVMAISIYSLWGKVKTQDRLITSLRLANCPKKGPLDQAKESEIYLRLQTLERAQTQGTQGEETSQPDSGLPQE